MADLKHTNQRHGSRMTKIDTPEEQRMQRRVERAP